MTSLRSPPVTLVTPSLSDYVFGETLGRGTYGIVYKACKKGSRGTDLCAIKCMSRRPSKAASDNLISEISILKQIKGEFVVQLHDFQWDNFYIYLIFEYCDAGDLRHYLQTRDGLHELVVKHFLQQLATALKLLRENFISHFDLKPHNLLLSHRCDRTLALKLADFGFAQHLKDAEEMTSLRGSLLYMAPEILQKQRYDARADLWSVGIIMYECLFGEAPFVADNFEGLARKIMSDQPIYIPKSFNKVSSGCRDLLIRLLQKDPEKRLSFDEFFDHSFLDLIHMPSDTTYKRGAAIIEYAVKLDSQGDHKEALDQYVSGLQFLLPLLTWGNGTAEFQGYLPVFRTRLQNYVHRAEELKLKLHVSNLKNAEEVKFLNAFDIATEADSLAEYGFSSEALEKYTKALEVMVPMVNKFQGEEKEDLYKTVVEWIARAENLKVICDADRKSQKKEKPKRARWTTSKRNRPKPPALRPLDAEGDFLPSNTCRVQ